MFVDKYGMLNRRFVLFVKFFDIIQHTKKRSAMPAFNDKINFSEISFQFRVITVEILPRVETLINAKLPFLIYYSGYFSERNNFKISLPVCIRL